MKNSIKLKNFKSLAEKNLPQHYFKEDSGKGLEDTLKYCINDLLDNVKYYNLLSDISKIESARNLSDKAKAIFAMNNLVEYKNTVPLFFKLLIFKESNRLNKEDFEKIIEYAFRFILTYQSICARESKHTAEVFANVQKEVNKSETNESYDTLADEIILKFNKTIKDNCINDSNIKNGIANSVTYDKNKNVTRVLLSYIENFSDGEEDYSKLLLILKSLGRDIQLDHIVPQNPKEDDDNFKFYVSGDNVVLKEGQDFIENQTSGTYNKNDFYQQYINVIGNLRLMWKKDNIKKSNHFLKLKEYDESFNSNADIVKNTETVINEILGTKLLLSSEDIGQISAIRPVQRIQIEGHDREIKFYKPISYVLFDESYTMSKDTYRELCYGVLKKLYALAEDQIRELAEEKYRPTSGERAYISSDKADLVSAEILDSGIYFEKNLSGDSFIKFLYSLMKELGFDEEDLVITLEETQK